MYALSASAEGDCYWCVPPDPGIAAAALGTSESGTLPSTALAQSLHTFTLDSGASRCFFRNSTTLTPLPAPVPVRLADLSGGPVVARSSTVLPCPAVPSGSLSGSSLYTLATEPPQVAASARVSASGQVAASCSCRLLSHQTLLWHHRLGHPFLPRLRGMHSCLLVSGLPRGGEFSSNLLRNFCRGEGILQSFTFPASPQQNGIAERCLGLVIAGDPTEPAAAGAGGSGAGGAGARGAGVGGTGAGCAGAAGAGAVDPGARGARGTVRPRPYFVPLLLQVLGVPSSPGLTPPLLCPNPDHTHAMALRHSSVPLRVPPPATPQTSLPDVPHPESDHACGASLTVSCLLATAVADPSFEFAAASALVAEVFDFGAACRLDYATALVAESASTNPPSVGGECILGTDVLEDRQEDFECLAAAVPRFASMLIAPEGDPDAPDSPTPRSYAEAITGPYSSQWQAAMDAEMASWKSTGTYLDEVPPSGANKVDGMWIFRVKRPPGSPPAFKARYVARGFSQRQGVDYFQTFSPTPKMITLWVLLHVAAQHDYELHSLDFSTAFLQGSLHEEIWLRCPLGFTGSFPAGTQ
ncbi:unnamed protein product [Closterium sp. NIES-53]